MTAFANPLDGLAVSAPPATKPDVRSNPDIRSNRYGGKCATCQQWVAEETGKILKSKTDGRWLVFHLSLDTCTAAKAEKVAQVEANENAEDQYPDLPAGYYGVEGKRYKIDKPNRKWAGWLFFKTGSDYYDQVKLGSARPGEKYSGKAAEVFEAIVADPEAALKEYARITGSCGICNRTLEDPVSVARGIGPVCWEKVGF